MELTKDCLGFPVSPGDLILSSSAYGGFEYYLYTSEGKFFKHGILHSSPSRAFMKVQTLMGNQVNEKKELEKSLQRVLDKREKAKQARKASNNGPKFIKTKDLIVGHEYEAAAGYGDQRYLYLGKGSAKEGWGDKVVTDGLLFAKIVTPYKWGTGSTADPKLSFGKDCFCMRKNLTQDYGKTSFTDEQISSWLKGHIDNPYGCSITKYEGRYATDDKE